MRLNTASIPRILSTLALIGLFAIASLSPVWANTVNPGGTTGAAGPAGPTGPAGAAGPAGSPNVPGGRLTLTTTKPVMQADATAQGTIFYDTYVGNTVPVAGTNLTIGSDEISLILDSTNQTSGNLYDVFAINVAGTLTLCAGPAWTNNTTRSQAIALSNGVWANSGSMANCFNNAVNKGPVSSGAGTYLGTFKATANGQTGMQFSPAGAAGGSNNILGLYNAYNRVTFVSTETDSNSTWTYNSGTFRQADNNANNRVTYIDGLGQSPVQTFNIDLISGNAQGEIGTNCNATTGAPTKITGANVGITVNWSISSQCAPTLGANFAQAMEASGTAATETFNGGTFYSLMVTVNGM